MLLEQIKTKKVLNCPYSMLKRERSLARCLHVCARMCLIRERKKG